MPLILPVLIPGAKVNTGALAWLLFRTMLLPLLVGVAVRYWKVAWADKLGPICSKIGTGAMALMMVVVIPTSASFFKQIGWRQAVVAVIIIAGAFLVGWLCGLADDSLGAGTSGLAILTSQRNMAAAMLVATNSFGQVALLSIMITGFVAFLGLMPVAKLLGNRATKAAAAS